MRLNSTNNNLFHQTKPWQKLMWYPRQCHRNLPDSERTVTVRHTGEVTIRRVNMGHCAYSSGSYTLILNWKLDTLYNKCANFITSRDFNVPARRTRDLRSSGLLHSEWWKFLTKVSGQPIGPIFRGQEFFMPPSGVRNIKGFLWLGIQNYSWALKMGPIGCDWGFS
jgi:hypothetical protein